MVTRADPDDESPATGPIFSNDPFSFDEADVAPWASAIAGEVGSRETAEAVVLRSGRLHTVEPPAPRTATAANTIASSSAPAQAASASPSLGETRGLDNVLYPMNADGSVDITVADINQGTVLGDCYFLSSLGEIAMQHPSGIDEMISASVSGTETVTLYEDADGRAVGWNTTSFKAVDIAVNNADFLNGGTWGGVNGQPGQAVWNNEQVIWPQVLENAFAQLTGGYSGIEYGGSPMLALETLTGRAATYNSPSQITSATLSTDWSAGDLMVFDTPDDDNSIYNLVGSHAYMFDGLSTVGGVTYADLLNPWGFDEPDAVPVSALAAAFVEIDIGQYVTPANAPSITGTGASVATTDKASVVPFPGVTVASAADTTETVTVKLSARANGTLSDADGGTVTASTGTYTIAGTAAAVTRALDALIFTPTAHQVAPGSIETTAISLTVADANGSTTASTSVAATAAVDAMILSGNAASASTNDLAAIRPFSSVPISEPDAGQTFTATVTLSTVANGTLSSSAGGSFNASTGTWTFSGSSVASVTAAIDALTFTPRSHQVTPGGTVSTTLSLEVSDRAGSSTSASETITTIATSQAMAVTGVPTAAVKITDESTAAPFSTVAVSDPDDGRTVSATVVLSNAAHGKLSSAAGGSTNAASGTWTISGTATAVTAALDALTLTPVAHEFKPGTVTQVGLSLALADSAKTSAGASATVAVTSATDPIQLGGLATTPATTDTMAARPFSSLTVSEPDAGQTLTATVTPSSAANVTLSNFGTGSLSVSGVDTVTGSATAVTAALDGLTATPVAHQGIGGSTVQTGFALKVTDTAGATTSASTTLSVGESALTVASGSTDTVSGTQTVAELLNNGTVVVQNASLDVSKLVDTASSGIFELDGHATLDIASIAASSATMSFIGSGNLLDIDVASAFGTKSGAGPLLSGFGGGDAIDIRNVSSAGITLNDVASTGLLQVMHGTSDLATLRFSNATLGPFHAMSDSAGGLLITLV